MSSPGVLSVDTQFVPVEPKDGCNTHYVPVELLETTVLSPPPSGFGCASIPVVGQYAVSVGTETVLDECILVAHMAVPMLDTTYTYTFPYTQV